VLTLSAQPYWGDPGDLPPNVQQMLDDLNAPSESILAIAKTVSTFRPGRERERPGFPCYSRLGVSRAVHPLAHQPRYPKATRWVWERDALAQWGKAGSRQEDRCHANEVSRAQQQGRKSNAHEEDPCHPGCRRTAGTRGCGTRRRDQYDRWGRYSQCHLQLFGDSLPRDRPCWLRPQESQPGRSSPGHRRPGQRRPPGVPTYSRPT
jgi:hypothetical protein